MFRRQTLHWARPQLFTSNEWFGLHTSTSQNCHKEEERERELNICLQNINCIPWMSRLLQYPRWLQVTPHTAERVQNVHLPFEGCMRTWDIPLETPIYCLHDLQNHKENWHFLHTFSSSWEQKDLTEAQNKVKQKYSVWSSYVSNPMNSPLVGCNKLLKRGWKYLCLGSAHQLHLLFPLEMHESSCTPKTPSSSALWPPHESIICDAKVEN